MDTKIRMNFSMNINVVKEDLTHLFALRPGLYAADALHRHGSLNDAEEKKKSGIID